MEALRLDRRLRIVDSPRHATVLLVAGALPATLHRPVALVHDALAHPRATVWWGDGEPDLDWLRDCPRAGGDGDVAATVGAVHGDLMLGRRASDLPVLTATTRTPWEGVGPYGHGGSGMTGGTPHGRPLAERADDLRDGLALDVLPLTVGPFFPAFPAGLALRVSLQGDVITEVEMLADPFLADSADPPRRTHTFDRARTDAVGLAELERARVSHHLRALSRSLRTQGLGALATRVLGAAVAERPPTDAVRRLLVTVERTGLGRAGAGVGILTEASVVGRGLGLLARASGAAQDARDDDPAYAGLAFQPITQVAGDARARLLQRIAEIRQSLSLAERAGDRVRQPGPALEDPRVGATAVSELLGDLLVGAEWGDAVTTIVSLDLAMGRRPPAAVGAEAA